MKGVKISAALFVILMLLIPMLSMTFQVKVQQTATNNSYSRPNSSNLQITAPSQQFKLYRVATKSIELITPHDYICGVLAAEMSPDAPAEALKAQAVASFTYACYKREGNLSNPQAAAVINGADFSDDSSQFEAYLSKTDAKKKWGANFDERWNKLDQIVNSVNDEAITYQGKTIAAVFFAISSGKTENCKDVWGTDLQYLRSVDSSWDVNSPGYESKITVSAQDFKSAITASNVKGLNFGKDPAKWVGNITRSGAGSIMKITVSGAELTGAQMRTIFKTRSANFQITYQSSSKSFVFDVKGYGHGVGLSQNGAKYLAQQGKSYVDILKYYYTGVEISDYSWPV